MKYLKAFVIGLFRFLIALFLLIFLAFAFTLIFVEAMPLMVFGLILLIGVCVLGDDEDDDE